MARKQNMTKTVAKGAAGVAAAAGVVALGATLMDKNNREGISKTVTDAYTNAYHQVTPAGKKRKNKRSQKKSS
jgi:hypothetical protein